MVILLWSGISMEANKDFHVIARPLFNAQTYIKDILEPYNVPYAPFIGEATEYLKATDRRIPRTMEAVI